MSLIQTEIDLCSQAYERIGSGSFTLANQATNVLGIRANLHYAQTKNSLLRSYEWNFARTRAALAQISTLTLDVMPTSAWAVGDTITGITSGATAEILTVTSETEYEIIHLDGTFEDGETITNADVEIVYWEGIEVEYEGETVYWFDDSDAEQVVASDLTVTEKTPDFEWDYQYHLPNDYKRLIKVYEDEGCDEVDKRWTIEGNRILTNYDTLNIRYVKNVTDPGDFDELFKEILILRLALKFIPATAGTKSGPLTAEIKEELKVAEGKARVINAQENNQTGRSDWNLARYGS